VTGKVGHQALPAFKMGVLLAAGILTGRHLPASSGCLILLVVLLAFGSIILVFLLTRRAGCPAWALSMLAAFICFVGGAAKISSDMKRAVCLPDSLCRPAVLFGEIQDPAVVVNGRLRLAVRSEALRNGGNVQPFRTNLLVTLILSNHDSTTPQLDYGMSVMLRGMIEPPSAERNPGEFSPREYYVANGVSHLMTVRGPDQVIVLDSSGGSWLMRELIVPVRRGMLSLIDRTIDGEEGEFLKGLMIGDRSGISQATRQAFVNSGVAHVLAVSGSNVAVVAAIFMFAFELMRLQGKLRIIAVLVALLGYMVLTGNQPPVVRATIMAFVFFLARFFQHRSNAYNAMGISAIIILAIDARQMFDIGFQLSFGAVLSIIYFYPKTNAWISRLPGRRRWQRSILWLLRICAVSLVATLGTLPLTAVSFGRVSVIGIAANIIVIPAVELSVVLGFASACASLASSWLAESYAAVNGLILAWTLKIIKIAGNLSCAYVDTTTFVPVDALPYYIGLFVLFNHEGRTLVHGTILLLFSLNVAIFAPRGGASPMARGVMRVSFIDVGQGDAILAELPEGRAILVDAGPRSRQLDAGETVVTPFLKRRGVTTIDLLVISHGHIDHAGGVASVMRHFPVGHVVSIGGLPPFLAELKKTGLRTHQWCDTIRAGMPLIELANARCYALYPLTRHARANADTVSDNRCIVFKLQYGDVSFLFTGDVDGSAEAEMVMVYGSFLHASLLKAGHHGSNTSSTPLFLSAVNPAAAVISVGRNNKFHHPSPLVVERLRALCGTPARTDEDGAVVYETDGKDLWRFNWR
jgi:competence protein ComEC